MSLVPFNLVVNELASGFHGKHNNTVNKNNCGGGNFLLTFMTIKAPPYIRYCY